MGPVAAAYRTPLLLFAAALAAATLACATLVAPAAASHETGGDDASVQAGWPGEAPDLGTAGEGSGGGAWDEGDVPWDEGDEADDSYDWGAVDAVDPDFGDPTVGAPAAARKKKAAAPRTTGAIRAANVPYGRLIATTARRYGVPVALFTALVWQESGFKADARSHAGARGLTQLMPATARGLGVRKIYDPAQNLSGGARYLRAQLLRFRSKRLALAAYNAGPGAVTRFRGVPPYAETRTYVKRILALEARLEKAGVR